MAQISHIILFLKTKNGGKNFYTWGQTTKGVEFAVLSTNLTNFKHRLNKRRNRIFPDLSVKISEWACVFYFLKRKIGTIV